MDWLQGRLNVANRATVQERDETSLRWAQGRAQELVDLLGLFQQAADVLTKRRT